jgi:hypothetical protein
MKGVVAYWPLKIFAGYSNYRIFFVRNSGVRTRKLASQQVLLGANLVSDTHCERGDFDLIFNLFTPENLVEPITRMMEGLSRQYSPPLRAGDRRI